MLLAIIKKEFLDFVSTPKWIFVLLICTSLILLSLYSGIRDYEREMQEYSAAMSDSRSALQNETDWNNIEWLDAVKIYRPPQPLGVLVSGIQPAVGREATLNKFNCPELTGSDYDANPLIGIFDRLDLTFVVRVVLSLLAIVLSYNAISGEKERGTLKLIVSNPVPRTTFLIGKAMGGFVSLLGVLVVPFVLSAIMLSVQPNISFSFEEWLRIGLIFAQYLLYITVFFSLGLFVSSCFGSSALSLLMLLFAWIVCINILPLASSMVAGQLNPIPSEQQIAAEKEMFKNQMLDSALPTWEKWREKNPGEFSDTKWRERASAAMDGIYANLLDNIYARNAAVEADYRNRQDRQQGLAFNLARVSPAASLVFGSMDLARTGPDDFRRFNEALRSYQKVLFAWTTEKSRLAMKAGQMKPDLAGMPEFSFQPESFANSLRAALPALCTLAVMLLLLGAGAIASFIRYDVR